MCPECWFQPLSYLASDALMPVESNVLAWLTLHMSPELPWPRLPTKLLGRFIGGDVLIFQLVERH